MVTFAGFLVFYLFFAFFSPVLVEISGKIGNVFRICVSLFRSLFHAVFVQLDTINKLLTMRFSELSSGISSADSDFCTTFVVGIFSLHQLIIAYSAAVCAKGLVLFVYLLRKGEVSFRREPGFISPQLRKR